METNELNNKTKEELVTIATELLESVEHLKGEVELYRSWKDNECLKRIDAEEMLVTIKKNLELYLRAKEIQS
jgi:hypothetical protein